MKDVYYFLKKNKIKKAWLLFKCEMIYKITRSFL